MNLKPKMRPIKCFTLKSNEVHIWSAFLQDHKNDISYFSSMLSKDEIETAKEFKFFKDQSRFIIARGILRYLLAKYLCEYPRNIEILYGLWGKPCLSRETPLHFNVSHSGDYVLYAVIRNFEVGIDIEYIDKNLSLEDLEFSILSPQDIDVWNALNSEEKVNFFFRGWVCKEALIKAYVKDG